MCGCSNSAQKPKHKMASLINPGCKGQVECGLEQPGLEEGDPACGGGGGGGVRWTSRSILTNP